MRISNFKQEKVAIQVWDRLPKADSETVGVTLLSQTPDLSVDPQYVREDRPKNLLRWDISVDKGVSGEKAATIDYQFKLEYARRCHREFQGDAVRPRGRAQTSRHVRLPPPLVPPGRNEVGASARIGVLEVSVTPRSSAPTPTLPRRTRGGRKCVKLFTLVGV